MPHTPASGLVGRAVQIHGPDSPEVLAARKALSTERARARAKEIASLDPEIDLETRVEIACLLLGRSITDARAELAEGRAS